MSKHRNLKILVPIPHNRWGIMGVRDKNFYVSMVKNLSSRAKVLNRNLIPIITVYSIPVKLFRKYRIVNEYHSVSSSTSRAASSAHRSSSRITGTSRNAIHKDYKHANTKTASPG